MPGHSSTNAIILIMFKFFFFIFTYSLLIYISNLPIKIRKNTCNIYILIFKQFQIINNNVIKRLNIIIYIYIIIIYFYDLKLYYLLLLLIFVNFVFHIIYILYWIQDSNKLFQNDYLEWWVSLRFI